jgi:hypothetical protein
VLTNRITTTDPKLRDEPLHEACAALSDAELLRACEELDRFWQQNDNLYERVRALMFLYALHRFILPARGLCPDFHPVPQRPVERIFGRRFEHAIRELLGEGESARRSDTYVSGLATAYHGLALQSLADQVRQCVRSVPGNRWMFRTGHPSEIPLKVRAELTQAKDDQRPCLVERTAVRMDLSHSAWSDIFFLAMDRPEYARVLNVSIDLCEKGSADGPRPPVEAWFRVIDRPVIRLVSVDLGTQVEVDNLPEVFDFGRDYLGLLKAALVASGIVPPGLEGSGASLESVLEALLGPDKGFELVSCVYNIPKGSRLAVSTNLMAALIAVCMRATGQIRRLEGGLDEGERSLLAARAILGEWLGGSGGGWQDSGGVWPGIKCIEGALAEPHDSEHGISRGKLLPKHRVYGRTQIPEHAREKLQNSLILIHGGLAQNVGPILEMVTERYLLRDAGAWAARQEALQLTEQIAEALQAGDIRELARLTTRNFFGPIKTIIPWASNAFTEALIDEVSEALGQNYWGFWMLGGMSGGGMGLIVDPAAQASAKATIAEILERLKARFENALPFAIDPVIYDFAINENGSVASFGDLEFPEAYYRLRLPGILRKAPGERCQEDRQDLAAIRRRAHQDRDSHAGWLEAILPDAQESVGQAGGHADRGLDRLLADNGFDPVAHEKMREQLLDGRVGLAQNRLHPNARIEDASPEDLVQPNGDASAIRRGRAALEAGEAAVVTLAAGAGSRWTQGAGVVKALHPFADFDGRYRNFVEVHLAKSHRDGQAAGAPIPHVFTTSYLTHDPIARWFEAEAANREARTYLSRGSSVGLRLVPTLRDLRFAWEETPQPQLDAQAQKMRDSVRAALKRWAAETGEGSDYRDNLPGQCLHPVGHWYEVPGLLLNGTLQAMLAERPQLKTLLLHNIDTLGARLDPELLGRHLASGKVLNYELISRRVDDVGGGLARIDGRLRLVEGLALPREEDEFKLSYYNTLTTWIDIDGLLAAFGLTRTQLNDAATVRRALRDFANRLPTYMTLKEVKKRWGRGQEDVFPVLQFERLWGDMSALDEVPTGFIRVDRLRGQQLKDAAQLDAWLRDGSHAYINKLCQFEPSRP